MTGHTIIDISAHRLALRATGGDGSPTRGEDLACVVPRLSGGMED